MAVSDETPTPAEPKAEMQPWRSGEPVLKHPVIVRRKEAAGAGQSVWVKSLLNLLQRRAPA
jgi:hypothetical protein